MTSDQPLTYASSGVDLVARQAVVARYKEIARRATGPQVIGGIGPFAGMFALQGAYQDPVLVATTDTVGTKGKIAALAGRYEGLGRDIVNHCINDAFTTGAEPLFFLDTIVSGDLSDEAKLALVSGVADACAEAGVVLLGGETADMPGTYTPGSFDLIGFIVGIVERALIVDGSRIAAGDTLLALPSNGLHTNGYSLARAALGIGVDPARAAEDRRRLERFEEELGETLADALLHPHRCYLPDLRPLLRSDRTAAAKASAAGTAGRPAETPIKGLAHITGGGLVENVPRILPPGLGARIERRAITPPPIFPFIQRAGGIDEAEMYRVFNMGFGMVLAVAPDDVEAVRALVPEAVVCGEVVSGSGVTLV
ncbi:MAG TPA: phosphoribosylformylglycinamidine cyclo-ligase [Dehalococcoidia bacterium]|nr:phosphoribosylformylglycinamidine cyclo-ligase [Dehalococcoidia bacterium]